MNQNTHPISFENSQIDLCTFIYKSSHRYVITNIIYNYDEQDRAERDAEEIYQGFDRHVQENNEQQGHEDLETNGNGGLRQSSSEESSGMDLSVRGNEQSDSNGRDDRRGDNGNTLSESGSGFSIEPNAESSGAKLLLAAAKDITVLLEQEWSNEYAYIRHAVMEIERAIGEPLALGDNPYVQHSRVKRLAAGWQKDFVINYLQGMRKTLDIATREISKKLKISEEAAYFFGN